jgi:hypothetical protein
MGTLCFYQPFVSRRWQMIIIVMVAGTLENQKFEIEKL